MARACKLCIVKNGLSGADIPRLPQTDEDLFEHIEAVHHMPVMREGETLVAAIKRFTAAHPEAQHCAECKQRGAPWATP